MGKKSPFINKLLCLIYLIHNDLALGEIWVIQVLKKYNENNIIANLYFCMTQYTYISTIIPGHIELSSHKNIINDINNKY